MINFFLDEERNFKTVSLKLDELGTSFNNTANNMERNAKDMEMLSGDFEEMSMKITSIGETFGSLSKSTNVYLSFFESFLSSISKLKFLLEILLF